MSEQINIAYHEVDFLLPIHRFDIRFSYVTKKGLSQPSFSFLNLLRNHIKCPIFEYRCGYRRTGYGYFLLSLGIDCTKLDIFKK